MSNINKKWTEEENAVLIECIKKNPHNIKEACAEAAKQLNRNTSACQQHWYKKLSPANNPIKTGVVFVSVGTKSVYKNRKITTAKEQPEKSSLWQKIKMFLNIK